ncbi:uncharacterized protein LOC113296127 [Papaver somniferum]|uniref:uncharacterized protein LOC113296127 n=1 Tax=Papaver somniferum TaxID=3469 RepID=UPI000E6FA040|nr:uncharacterized protein LOC113296127 [Papaver somniferum]
MNDTARKLQFQDWVVIPSIEKSGGQIVSWANRILVNLVEVKFNIITVEVKIKGILSYISCIYRALNVHDRTARWEYLLTLNEIFNDPWLLVGDMNFILNNTEKEGGNEASTSIFNLVHRTIQQIGFMDLGFHGDPFTWSNQREGESNIRERIDRGLVNVKWFNVSPDYTVYHLSRVASDHNPLLLDVCPVKLGGSKPYKYFRGWKEHKDYNMFVENAWSENRGVSEDNIVQTLKSLATYFGLWNKNIFKNKEEI